MLIRLVSDYFLATQSEHDTHWYTRVCACGRGVLRDHYIPLSVHCDYVQLSFPSSAQSSSQVSCLPNVYSIFYAPESAQKPISAQDQRARVGEAEHRGGALHLGYIGLQAGIRTVAGWDAYGCRLGYIGLQHRGGALHLLAHLDLLERARRALRHTAARALAW